MSVIYRLLFAPVSNAVLYWMLVAFNIADYFLTKLILERGGAEANPFVLFFINMFGPIGIIIAKVPPLILLGVLLFRYWHDIQYPWKVALRRTLVTLNFMFYILVVYSSFVLYTVL